MSVIRVPVPSPTSGAVQVDPSSNVAGCVDRLCHSSVAVAPLVPRIGSAPNRVEIVIVAYEWGLITSGNTALSAT